MVLAVMLAGIWLAATDREGKSGAVLRPDRAMTLFADPTPLKNFALTDHQNRVFDLSRLTGKWSFLFFGFTHCPDICPATLAILARARENIARNPGGAEDVQFVFISVDPKRDTAIKLKQYVGYFNADFLGVTGDDAQIGNLAGQLEATYQIGSAPGVDNYPVFHSTTVFLVDPRGRYHAKITPPFDADTISRRFRVLRKISGDEAK